MFDVIGITFGAGDGSTTFNLPDFRGRFIQGANGDLGSVKSAGLPNITGTLKGYITEGGRIDPYAEGGVTGCFSKYAVGDGVKTSMMYADTYISDLDNSVRFDASDSSSIYGRSTTVQPPAIALNVFIKY